MSLMRKAASAAILSAATAIFAVGIASAAAAQTASPSPTPTPAGAKTCADFKTQADAQAYFTSHGGSKANNFDNLDPNRNGIACEGLPGTPSATATPTVAPAATSKPLPNNGIFSDIMAMSGLSLLEAGIGLSLLSERIRSGGKRAPLFVLKLLAKAARQGRDEVALADDVYIVRKASETKVVEEFPRRTISSPKPAAPARLPTVLFTPPIEPPASVHRGAVDEWSAAVALENIGRDDADWPYFTPPDL
jgi:hypothetical protein